MTIAAARMILPRAAALAVKSFIHARDVREEVAEHNPGDRTLEAVLKAATSPTTMGTYAATLGQNVVADFMVGLAGPSAFASLRAEGLDLPLMGYASQRLPARIVTANDAGGWVAEAAPIPSIRLDVDAGPTMEPSKVAIIANVTRELAEHAFGIPVLQQIITEAAALQLDSKAFSTDAASAGVSPAGLFAGVTPIGAGASIAADLKAMLTAIVAAGGGNRQVLVGSPPLIQAFRLAYPLSKIPAFPSAAMPAASVAMFEASSFVSGFGPIPEFRVSSETVVVENTVAAPISTAGTPATVAAPLRSLYQTDCTSLKMVLRCAYCMRATGHVQLITNANWV